MGFKLNSLIFKLILPLWAVSEIVISQEQFWVNTYEPPMLKNPLIFIKTADLPIKEIVSYGITCAGLAYWVKGVDRDVLIDLSGDAPLTYPLLLSTSKNVIVRGVSFDLAVQDGCDVNDLPNAPVDLYPNMNVKPRPPTGRVIGLTVKGVAWLEGVYINVNGHNADCIVWSAPPEAVDAYGDNSSVFFVNSRCDHYDGHGESEIGHSLHADLFQNQVGAPSRLIFENVVATSGNEGIVNNRPGTQKIEIKNFTYLIDKKDQLGPQSDGPMLATDVPDDSLLLVNVWIDGNSPAIWGEHNGDWPANWRFDPHNDTHAGIPGHFGITRGVGPDFAPISSIGKHYRTPFVVVDEVIPEPLSAPGDLVIELE